MIGPGFIGRESFEDALSQEKNVSLEKEKHYLEMRFIDDFHGYMSWWVAFDENRANTSEIGGNGLRDKESKIESKKRGRKKRKPGENRARSVERKNRRR